MEKANSETVQSIFEQEFLNESIKPFLEALSNHSSVSLSNLHLSGQAFALACLNQKIHLTERNTTVIITSSVKQQEEIYEYLNAWNCEVLVYPELSEIEVEGMKDVELEATQLNALNSLFQRPYQWLLTTKQALLQKVPDPDLLNQKKIILSRNALYDPEELKVSLEQTGYTRENLVVQRGQWTQRGGIIDCFPWNLGNPVRVEWIGNTIDSIREFDSVDQTSLKEINEVEIPLYIFDQVYDNQSTLAAYLPKKTHYIFLFEEDKKYPAIETNIQEHTFLHHASQDAVMRQSRYALLKNSMQEWLRDKWSIWVTCNNEGELERLKEWLNTELHIPSLESSISSEITSEGIHFIISSLPKGFVWLENKLCVLTDSEIFARYQHAVRITKKQAVKTTLYRTQKVDFNELELGDYVVHIDHGIGIYHGVHEVPLKDDSPSTLR